MKNACFTYYCCNAALLGCFMVSLLLPFSAQAYEVEDILTPQGKSLIRLHVYQPGEQSPEHEEPAKVKLPPAEMNALKKGILYLHSIIGDIAPGATPIIDLIPLADQDDNASAGSSLNPVTQNTLLGDAFMHGIAPENALNTVAGITINRASPHSKGWYTESLPVLPNNGMGSDLPGTMAHEMFHALGLDADIKKINDTTFSFKATTSKWVQGLRDVYGTPAQADMLIQELHAEDLASSSPDPNTFFMLNANAQGGAYFTGTHVEAVLKGAYIAWPDDSNTAAVPGLPINGYEDSPELSHVELQNSLMSHQSYRNWTTLLEAELAILQDLGYSVNRRLFFGNSIYGSGTEGSLAFTDNASPFYARNSTGDGWREGAASPQDWGIGLHVYGSWNHVRQSADLLTVGEWGMGIRMDGMGNQLTIAPGVRVHADGAGGNGLLVAYGRDHHIANQGNIQALGLGGVAARFDFGSNELGDYTEYRGSYLRTAYQPDIATWENLPLVDALNGPLVKHFDVTGRLAGSAAAIYISPNALVERIDIMKGANLQGDIISEWNPSNPLYPNVTLQAPQGAVLTTELAFGRLPNAEGKSTASADPSFALRYNGTIHGPDSLRLNMAGGILSYNGSAHVLSASVAANAIFTGNNTLTLAKGTGLFTNAGTIAPGNSIGAITINGGFTNTGTLAMEFDGKGSTDTLKVTGTFLHSQGGKVRVSPVPDYYAAPLTINTASLFSGATGSTLPTIIDTFSPPASPTLSMNMTQNGNAITINTLRASNAYSQYAASGNAARAARALRDLAPVAQDEMQYLLTSLDFSALNGSAVSATLPQLTAVPYARAAQASAEANMQLGRMALAHLRAVTDRQQQAAGTVNTGNTNNTDGNSPQWSAFVMPFGGGSLQQQYQGAPAYSSSQVGLMGGVYRQADQTRLSLYSAFSRRQVDIDTAASAQARGSALHLGAAALWAQNPQGAGSGWQAWTQAQLGVENTDMQRSIAFDGYALQNKAFYTSFNGGAQLGGGYLWRAGEMSFGPQIGLEYAFNTLPNVQEDSGGLRLGMDAHTRHDLRSTAGLMTTWNKDLGEGRALRANLEAVWRQDLLPNQRDIGTHFVGYSQYSFDTRMEREGQSSLGLNGGIQVDLRQDVTLSAQVEADLLRPGYSNVGGGLALRWEF